jgi:hypothetical protein
VATANCQVTHPPLRVQEIRHSGVNTRQGLARVLTERGVATPRGGSTWTGTTVARVLARVTAGGKVGAAAAGYSSHRSSLDALWGRMRLCLTDKSNIVAQARETGDPKRIVTCGVQEIVRGRVPPRSATL